MKMKNRFLSAGFTCSPGATMRCLQNGGRCYPWQCPPNTYNIGRCCPWRLCCRRVSCGLHKGNGTV
uniref:Beta-defensin-like domain-containing protein n=1 Tax=Terrapene triunguis TaxID=2587831 RepID=A0A674J4H2_9SAUR